MQDDSRDIINGLINEPDSHILVNAAVSRAFHHPLAGIRSVSIQVYPSRWDCRLGEVMFCVMMASPRSSN